MTEKEKNELAEIITANIIGCTKDILTSDEVAKYLGISRSYLYKLTMRKEIPHYKPLGKMVFFDRKELIEWIKTGRIATCDEIREKAQKYINQKPI